MRRIPSTFPPLTRLWIILYVYGENMLLYRTKFQSRIEFLFFIFYYIYKYYTQFTVQIRVPCETIKKKIARRNEPTIIVMTFPMIPNIYIYIYLLFSLIVQDAVGLHRNYSALQDVSWGVSGITVFARNKWLRWTVETRTRILLLDILPLQHGQVVGIQIGLRKNSQMSSLMLLIIFFSLTFSVSRVGRRNSNVVTHWQRTIKWTGKEKLCLVR